jgi:PAS domain S-box-containing protein
LSFFAIGWLLLSFLVINTYLYRVLTGIRRTHSEKGLRLLSIWQIAIELILFAMIMQLMGEGSMASVFFFLPIITASTMFGVRGALITAIISGVLVNISVVLGYFEIIYSYFANPGLFDLVKLEELKHASQELISAIVTSNFYLILALVSGYSSKLLYSREKNLIEQAEKLSMEKKVGEKEAIKLGKDTQLLHRQDIELKKKIAQLEKSEKSMIRAFADLQIERRRANEEKEKTSAIISNFIDPIIVIDKDNKLQLFNPAAHNIFGFIANDLGKAIKSDNNYSMENFKTMIKHDFVVKGYQEIKSHNPNEEEVVIKIAEQDLTYKVITAKVKDNEGQELGTMKIFYNLTREKMIDKLKSEFISIAAHQLRTPLSAIKWVIKMVLDGDVGKLNAEQEKFLYKGYQSNERIIALVNDMLNVSRIEEGRFGYSFNKENFLHVVDGAIASIDGLIREKNIKLIINKPKKLDSIYIDKQKMGLVMQNLLENAVKYTPEFGKIEISLETGDELIKVRVKDNGVGIPEKDKAKLFSKFFRAENVVRMQTEGSGLGLFIVKNIIKRHGGEIMVESEEGKGTEFVFTLPIKHSIE